MAIKALEDQKKNSVSVQGTSNSSNDSNNLNGGKLSGGVPANFNNLYNEIARKSEEANQKKNDERKKASAFDLGAKFLMDAGEKLTDLGGASTALSNRVEESGGAFEALGKDPVGTLWDLGRSLPGSMIGSPFKGAGEMHEVFTGRDAQSLDDNNTISAQELTPSQRGWEGLDAAINLGGNVIGGTARVGGAVGRAVKAAAGAESKTGKVLDTIMPSGGRGLFAGAADDAYRGGRAGEGTRVGGFFGQLASDAAEEGVEEFVQTYAEHGRAGDNLGGSDVFSEAIEAGKMGAIGGAMMSGAGGTAHLIADLHQRRKAQPADQQGATPTFDTQQYEATNFYDVQQSNRLFTMAKNIQKNLDTKAQASRAGSPSLTAAYWGGDIHMNSAKAGSDAIAQQWQVADQGARSEWAGIFGQDEGTLDQMFAPGHVLTNQEILTLNNGLKQSRENGRRLTVTRSPASTDTHAVSMYLDEIVPGHAIYVHPMVHQLSGGDVDADKRSIMIGVDNDRSFLLPTQLWKNPDGSTDYNFDFFPVFDHGDVHNDVARDRLRDRLGRLFPSTPSPQNQFAYSLVYGYQQKHPSFFTNLIDSIAKAQSDPEAFINNMNDLHTYITQNFGARRADDFINEIVTEIFHVSQESDVFQSNLDACNKNIQDLTRDVAAIAEEENLGDIGMSPRSGSVGNAKNLVNIAYRMMDALSLAIRMTGAVQFRENAALKQNFASFQQGLVDLDEEFASRGTTAYAQSILGIFKICGLGEHLVENCTDLFNSRIIVDFMAEILVEGNQQNRVGAANGISVDDFINSFLSVYGVNASRFNEAASKIDDDGWRGVVGSIPKMNLRKGSGDVYDAVMCEQLMNVIGELPFSMLFDIPDNSHIAQAGLTVNQVISEVYDGTGWIEYYYSDNPDMLKLLRSLSESYGSKNAKLEVRIKNQFKEVSTLEHADATNPIDSRNFAQAYGIGDAILGVQDPMSVVKLGIADPLGLAKSIWGRMIYEGNVDERMSASLSIALTGRYYEFLQIMHQYRQETDADTKACLLQKAQREAAMQRNGSALSEMIYLEITEGFGENGELGTTVLDRMRSTDVLWNNDDQGNLTSRAEYDIGSYASKQAYYDLLCEHLNRPKEKLLVDALNGTPTSAGGLSEVSSRMMDNQKRVTKESRTYRQKQVAEVSAFMDVLDKMPEQQKNQSMTVIRDMALDSAYDENLSISTSVFLDSVNHQLKEAEKGAVNQSAAMSYKQTEMMVKGGSETLVAEMMETPFNTISFENIISNKKIMCDILFDGREIICQDPGGDSETVYNLEYFLGERPAESNGTRMSIEQFKMLLRKYPQFIDIIKPHIMSPTLSFEEDGSVKQEATEKISSSLITAFNNSALWKMGVDESGNIDGAKTANAYEERVRRTEKKALTVELMRSSNVFNELVALTLDIDKGYVTQSEVIDARRAMVDSIYSLIAAARAEADGQTLDRVGDSLYEYAMDAIVKQLRAKANADVGVNSEISRRLMSAGEYLFSSDFFVTHITADMFEDGIKSIINSPNTDQKIKQIFIKLTSLETGVDQSQATPAEVAQSLVDVFSHSDACSALINTMIRSTGMNEVIRNFNQCSLCMNGRNRVTRYMIDAIMAQFGARFQMSQDMRARFEALLNRNFAAIRNNLDIDNDLFFDLADVENGLISIDEALDRYHDIIFDPRFATLDNAADFANGKKLYEEIREDLEDWLVNPGNRNNIPLRNRARENHLRIHQFAMNALMNKIASRTNVDVNTGATFDAYQAISSFRDLMENLISNPKIKTKGYSNVAMDRDSLVNKMPRFNLDHPAMPSFASNVARYTLGGKIQGDTAVQGMESISRFGMAFIPHDMECEAARNAATNPIPWSEARKLILNMADGVMLEVRGERKLASDLTGNPRVYGDNEPVVILDPAACTCPFCSAHHGKGSSQNYMYKGYNGPIDAWKKVMHLAMEAMNLKLKKSIDPLMQIVPNVAERLRNENDDFAAQFTVNTQGMDIDTIRNRVRDSVYGPRVGGGASGIVQRPLAPSISDELYHQFWEVLESHNVTVSDIPDIDIRNLAIASCFVWEVTGVNGHREYVSIDALNNDTYVAQMNVRLGGSESDPLGSAFVKMVPSPKSIGQISNRIEGKVLQASNANRNLTKDEVQDIAWNAIFDWSSYNQNSTMTPQFVASMMPVLGDKTPSHVIPQNSPSGHMKWFDSLSRANDSKRRRFFSAKPASMKDPTDGFIEQQMRIQGIQGEKNKEGLESVRQDLRGSNKFIVTKVVLGQSVDNNLRKTNAWEHVERLRDNLPEDKFYAGYNSAIIYYPSNNIPLQKILEADTSIDIVKEFEGFRYILVPESAVNREEVPSSAATVNMGGINYYQIDTHFNIGDRQDIDGFKYGTVLYDPKMPCVILEDSTNVIIKSDAPYAGNDAFWKNQSLYISRPIKISGSLLNGGTAKQILGLNDLREAAQDILDGEDDGFPNVVFPYIDNNREETLVWQNFFSDIRNLAAGNGNVLGWQENDNGYAYQHDSFPSNKMFALVRQNLGNGRFVYMPLINTTGLDQISSIKNIRVNSDGDFLIDQETYVDRSQLGTTLKVTQSGASNKGIVANIDDGTVLPESPDALSSFGLLVANSNTVASRIRFQRDSIAKKSVYYLSKMQFTSFLYQVNNNGAIEINQFLNVDEQATDQSNALTPSQIDQLSSPNSDRVLLQAIADGTKKLFKTNAAKNSGEYYQIQSANMVASQLASECLNGTGISFTDIVCPWDLRVKDSKGNWVIANFSQVFKDSGKKDLMNEYEPVVKNTVLESPSGVFRRYNYFSLTDLYATMNKDLCPARSNLDGWVKGSTLMDIEGRILATYKGVTSYWDGQVDIPITMLHDDFSENVPTNVNFGMQSVMNKCYEHGMSKEDWEFLRPRFMSKYCDLSGYNNNFREDGIGFTNTYASQMMESCISNDMLNGFTPISTYAYSRYKDEIAKTGNMFKKMQVKVIIGSGDNKTVLNGIGDLRKNKQFQNIRKSFARRFDIKEELVTPQTILNLYYYANGYTYNDGEGITEIKLNDIENLVNKIGREVDGHWIFIEGGIVDNGTKDRISIPWIESNFAQWLWEVSGTATGNSPLHQNFNNSYNEWQLSMRNQFEISLTCLGDLTLCGKGSKHYTNMSKKKDALKKFAEYVRASYHIEPESNDAFFKIEEKDLREAYRLSMLGLFPDTDPAEYQNILDHMAQSQAEFAAQQERVNAMHRTRWHSDTTLGGVVSTQDLPNLGPLAKLSNFLVGQLRFMSMLEPGILVGNLIEGRVRGAGLDAAMALDFGPWGKNQRTLPPDFVAQHLSHNPEMLRLLRALRECQIRGDDELLIMGLSNGQDLDTILESIYGEDPSVWQKVKTKVYSIASGGDIFDRAQLRWMINMLDTYLTQGDYPEWMAPDPRGSGVSRFQMALEQDPVRFIVEGLNGDSTIRSQIIRALNNSSTFSLGHNNVVSFLVEQVTERYPLARFITATTVSPFFRYMTNVSGNMLNAFFPMSTLNYVVTKQLGGIDALHDKGIEQVQTYTSLRYAVMADACKMSFHLLGSLIIALGLVGFPDDDDKRGDYREYTFFGMRINDDFVLSDLLGPTMPYACFLYSAMHGEPRFDLLFNGLSSTLTRNPMFSLGEIIDTLGDPEGAMDELEDEASIYDDAFGGTPTGYEYEGTTVGVGIGVLASRIFTPAFIRTMSVFNSPYELSYKKVWDTESGDIDVSSGQIGDTVRVSAEEAMIRKATRNNPLFGIFMNIVNHPDTSYGPIPWFANKEMTPVVYQDPIQRNIMKQYSINTQDENGNYIEKTDAEKEQVALNIIATLQQYDDMEELYETGFLIDSDTRFYVGQKIWDTVTEIQTTYYNWANSEEADNYVLGNGDFQAGAAIKQDAYNNMQTQVQYWKNFYYQKLNSEEMRRGSQEYLRENVSYRMDDDGNYYASGFNNKMSIIDTLTGIKVAPGTLDDAQGTMGYEGDWATPSAVTGTSTGQRSLVPLNQDYSQTPDFDSYANEAAQKALESAKNGNSSSSSSSGSKYYSKYSGSRSYGRSSGGSGGSGGSTYIYSRPASTNAPTGKTVSIGNPYDSKFDYLRPGFETKGSRESYKRSDF